MRAVSLPRNVGDAGAANRGVDAATGEYVAFLNDDMEVAPEWIERLAAELDRDPRLGVVTSKVMFDRDRALIYQAGYEFYTYGWCATRGVHEVDQGQYDVRLPSVGAQAQDRSTGAPRSSAPAGSMTRLLHVLRGGRSRIACADGRLHRPLHPSA